MICTSFYENLVSTRYVPIPNIYYSTRSKLRIARPTHIQILPIYTRRFRSSLTRPAASRRQPKQEGTARLSDGNLLEFRCSKQDFFRFQRKRSKNRSLLRGRDGGGPHHRSRRRARRSAALPPAAARARRAAGRAFLPWHRRV